MRNWLMGETMLRNALSQAGQAAHLQADVAKSGKISASWDTAEGYIEQAARAQRQIDQPPPPDNAITRFLGNKYTPVASAAVGVLCTDGLTLVFPHLYPAWYFIGRLAMVTSLASTGYQAREGLHGTTKTDFYLSLGMTVIGLKPGGLDIAMAHLQFFYAVYTTWIRK